MSSLGQCEVTGCREPATVEVESSKVDPTFAFCSTHADERCETFPDLEPAADD